MKNIIDKILDENDHDILEWKGQNGETIRFEQIALLELDEIYYTILHPIASDVGADDVFIFRIDIFDGEAELVLEENEEILNECLSQYEELYDKKSK